MTCEPWRDVLQHLKEAHALRREQIERMQRCASRCATAVGRTAVQRRAARQRCLAVHPCEARGVRAAEAAHALSLLEHLFGALLLLAHYRGVVQPPLSRASSRVIMPTTSSSLAVSFAG
uniref:Uncharacterized protein n=1 Tax=Coccolithus braarudii TaxID=221442 RepID=A0A7S0L0F7_9EUKA|mmetsp:Transcript_13299/g.28736  ORF Transcript_13299/g.28736 Transcript_13299/m.28736 type:complete len:119 (+) Transcript_13299:345-701(+)